MNLIFLKGKKKGKPTRQDLLTFFTLNMHNYSQNALKMQDTWLHIAFNSDISDELGNTVPYPQYYYTKDNKIVYCWLLDGFFETRNNIAFLNDIIARFKITFDDCQYIKRNTVERSSICPLKLRYFQNLKSRAIQITNNTVCYDSSNDFVFWCLKLHAEHLIKEKTIFSQNELTDFAMENFIDKCKDRSTLKAKCKSIYNWYLNRNFELTRYIKKDKEEVMATRLEHINKVNEQRKANTKAKIENAITGLMAESMFKKKNGTWNAVAIADYLQMQPRTVRKYLKELK